MPTSTAFNMQTTSHFQNFQTSPSKLNLILNKNKKSELMLMRHARAYGSSCSQLISLAAFNDPTRPEKPPIDAKISQISLAESKL